MILSLNNFKNREIYLKNIITSKEDCLKSAPKGILVATCSKGDTKYYVKSSPGDRTGTYLKQSEHDMAVALAQRDYDQRVLKCATAELSTLNKLIQRYEKGTPEDVYTRLSPARRELVTPILLPDDEFIAQWLATPYEGKGFSEGYPEFYTDKNLRVRSKSEIFIANRYDSLGIPMLYEKPILLEGFGWVSPDFTLLNVRLRKEFIHDHLGMMDDPKYIAENMPKIQAYMKNGYLPGKNLILTFETKDCPFDVRIIDDIAKQFLL